jgi:RNase P subunit RPR2
MAEKIRLKVKCHACGFIMEGTAKYGKGNYHPEGMDFQFTAVGKLVDKGVKGQVEVLCPNCETRNRFDI